MKKLLLTLGFAALFAFSSGAMPAPAFAAASGKSSVKPAQAERLLVAIFTPDADHGWTGGVVWWAEQAVRNFGREHPNIEFVFHTSSSDKEQATQVERMLERKIDALVILPHRPAPLTTVLNKAHNSGTFIVVVDRSIPKVPKDVYLAGDNFGFGRECGLYLGGFLQGAGKVLVMEGIPCEGNTLRVNGFKQGLADAGGDKIEILDSQPAYWSPPKAYDLMLQYLDRHPEVDAVWCGDDDVLEAALKAYAESGRRDVRLFLGGGGSKNIVKKILDRDPLVRATVTYPPNMVHESVRLAVEKLTAGKKFEREITIPSELVTIENAESFYYPDSVY